VGDDVAARVKDGQAEQFFLEQVQDVHHPAGAAVAVEEGMDGLKLGMAHGHADQWVQLGLVVQKALPVGQQVSPVRSLASWVPVVVRRMSMSAPLRVRQISTAVAVHRGRSFSDRKPRCKADR